MVPVSQRNPEWKATGLKTLHCLYCIQGTVTREDFLFWAPAPANSTSSTFSSRPLSHLHPNQEAQAYADDNSLLFMETSAKTAMNVNEIFMAIGKVPLLSFSH